MQKFAFAEMNIVHRGNPAQTLNIVRRAIRMGYDAVVINVDIGQFGDNDGIGGGAESDELQPPSKKKRKKQKQQEGTSGDGNMAPAEIVPDPFLVDESQLDLSSFEAAGKRFRQFSRLTVTLDANSVHKLQHNARVKRYDIVAVRVPDEQLLLTLQRKGDFVDLVTLDDPGVEVGRIPWLYKQKIVQSCIAVGIHFELCYGQAIQSSATRRQFFAHARKLMEITRGGRGIVLSSGTSEMIALRAPYDVSNMCTLFGLPPKSGRKFVSDNPLEVLLRSQTRKTIKGAIHIADLTIQNAPIPSTSNQAADDVVQQLSQIEEFQRELACEVEGEGGEKEEEAVEENRRKKKKGGGGGR